MDLSLSTSSLIGKFNNINFNEISLITLPYTNNIVQIKSNFYSICHPDYEYKIRKPKVIKVIQKKDTHKKGYRQGNGQCFNSQISFNVKGMIYIKLFRNGSFTCSGVKCTLEEVSTYILLLEEYIQEFISSKCIFDITSLQYILQNYKVKLDFMIDIIKLEKYLDSEGKKYIRVNSKIITKFDDMHKEYFNERLEFIKKEDYIFINPNNICDYISHDYFVLFMSFNVSKTLLLIKAKKYSTIVTIKVFKSGRINIDGKQTYEEAKFYYEWILDVINNNL